MKRISNNRRHVILWAALVATLSIAGQANAVGPFGGGFFPRQAPYQEVRLPRLLPEATWHGPSYYDRYQYLNSHYPKYYGGFHDNYFHKAAFPTGDYGPRGNGIYFHAWQ